MAVDVSGLVQMLATQPAKTVTGIGESLLSAQEGVREREQQEFENQVAHRKLQLEEAVANQKMSMNEVEMAGKRGELLSGIAQAMLVPQQDPMVKQQILHNSIPMLKKAGISDEQIQFGLQNINNPEVWKSIQVAAVANTEYWKTTSAGSSQQPTVAAKKKQELIEAGVPAEQAEGIAYGTYKFLPDPNTGDIVLYDTRNPNVPIPDDLATQLEPYVSKREGGEYVVKPLVKGTKEEQRRAKAVTELSDDLQKTGVPRTENILNRIENAISGAIDEKGEVVGDIPGYGLTAAAPDWAVSRKAQDLRQDLVKLFNIELAERSGAAVTKQELDRLRDEFKAGMFKTDRQLVQGIRAYRSLLEDYKKAVFAGYGDDVKQQYWGQGGLTFREDKSVVEKPPIAQSPTAEQIRADGKKYKWSEEQIEAAIQQYVREQ